VIFIWTVFVVVKT